MALPTTNLTGHWDASDGANMFSDDAGTTLAVDGGTVRNMHSESDASVQSHMDRETGSNVGPDYHTTSSVMKKASISFPGTNLHQLMSFDTADTNHIFCTSYWGAGAKTTAIAFYPVAITGTGSDASNDDVLLACEDRCGFYLVDVSGTKKIRASNWNGTSYNSCDLTLAVNRTWIAIFTHDGSTLAMTLIDDTGTETTASVSSGDSVGTGGFSLEIGDCTAVSTILPYNGVIGEFALYNAVLSGSNMTDLKQYFKDNWMSLATATKKLPALGVG